MNASGHNSKRPRAALMTIGSGPIACAVFEELRRSTDLRAVVISRKQRKASRWARVREYGLWYSFQFVYSVLMNKWRRARVEPDVTSIRVREWTNTADEDDIAHWLDAQKIELVVVCGFQFRLTERFLSRFRCCVNLHPSLLPAYRGPEPIMWGLLRGERYFGLTLHMLDAGLDTGDIVSQERREVASRTNFGVELELSKCVPRLVSAFVAAFSEGRIVRVPQTGGEYLPSPTLLARRRMRK